MFGTVPEPGQPEPVQSAATKPTSALADQAQAVFAAFGAKVSVGSSPRALRPGSIVPRRLAPSVPTAATHRSSFTTPGDGAAARAREQEMAAEADLIDDTFADYDTPGY
jgi:hypothetical protein